MREVERMPMENGMTRRGFMSLAAQSSVAALAASHVFADDKPKDAKADPRGKAEHCIFVWLGGGAAHIDTWDPKRRGDGKKIAGSAYDAIETAIPGVKVTEH